MKLSVKIAVFIFFTLHISALFAEADYNVFCRDKKTLNSAQIAFENQNYGEALKLAEEAKQIRKERNRYEISLLENSFKPAEVKYAGDSLADTLKVLADRQDYDAIEIIDWYSKIVRNFDFNDSKNKFMDYLRGISEYPEADYLIASIYKLEGEYEFAVRYYNQCLKNSDVLVAERAMQNTLLRVKAYYEKIKAEKIIVIVRGVKKDKLVPLAEAMYQGGIRLLEITYDAKGIVKYQAVFVGSQEELLPFERQSMDEMDEIMLWDMKEDIGYVDECDVKIVQMLCNYAE